MGDSVRPDWSGRLDKVWRLASQSNLAALVVSAPVNLTYLAGFQGSQGYLVVTAADRWLVLDGRYEHSARVAAGDGRLAPVRVRGISGPFDAALTEILEGLPRGSVGFEAERVTVAQLQRWQKASPAISFAPTSELVEAVRIVKDGYELDTIRRACAALSDVARHLRSWVAAGRTEREVAARIDDAIRRAGFTAPAFQTIVASGPNSAHPHARPTDRQLRHGDLVVLDFGGVLDGYCGDLTRMASVGQVQANARALVDAVRAAQESALAVVRAGALASDVDKAARDVLTDHGLGDGFLHATGHGLGLELHEAPRIGRVETDRPVRLEAGMVCTIEPGAYVEGLGGARLEDDVVVTPAGCEVLTSAPRDLIVV